MMSTDYRSALDALRAAFADYVYQVTAGAAGRMMSSATVSALDDPLAPELPQPHRLFAKINRAVVHWTPAAGAAARIAVLWFEHDRYANPPHTRARDLGRVFSSTDPDPEAEWRLAQSILACWEHHARTLKMHRKAPWADHFDPHGAP